MITAILSKKIAFPKASIPSSILSEAKEYLQIRNLEKDNMQREHVKGWESLPDFISYWEEDEEYFYAPRGFLGAFRRGLGNDVPYQIKDYTVCPTVNSYEYKEIALRPYQEKALNAIIKNGQGIYKAPTAAGKTVTALETIRRLNTRAIILVDKLSLANQWIDRCNTFLGYDPGLIGEGRFEVKDITIALKQSLWSKKLSDYFYDLFGAVIYDECHHVTASTYQQIIQRFSARYLIGISATPKREEWTFPIAKFYIGDIIHETTDIEVKEHLIKPNVKIISSDFYFHYRPSYTTKSGQRVQNNYKKMILALIADTTRNSLIADIILSDQDSATLVFSSRLDHFDNINLLLGEYPYPIFFLTGSSDSEERIKIQQYADENPCLIFSTVADEGIDIPNLERLIFAYPTKKPSAVIQKVGRVKRKKPGKERAEVFDISDPRISVFRKQLQSRLGAYKEMNLDPEIIGRN